MSKTQTQASTGSFKSLVLLSGLLFPSAEGSASLVDSKITAELAQLKQEEFQDLVALADTNHVIVRVLEIVQAIYRDIGDTARAGWASDALDAERARIDNAVSHLSQICAGFDAAGFDITVIKSLDHWPDLGSDLDLYTNTKPDKVLALMKDRFGAKLAPRSWGDRLANKWNFLIPGLPESVEIHMRRLGQTGEQRVIASKLAQRSRTITVAGKAFRVCSVADRLMISTLQRMYRHFYFRLCDIADSAWLVESGAVDFNELRRCAVDAGIWEGTATYLVIVSDYVKEYRGVGLELPHFVRDTARFGGEEVYFGRSFLRVPIMPQSVRLYGTQLSGLLRKRELHSSARLGLLPWLATAAVVGQKITGSDKGIW